MRSSATATIVCLNEGEDVYGLFPWMLTLCDHASADCALTFTCLPMRLLFLLPLFFLSSGAPRPPRIVLPGYFTCQSVLLEESGNALVCYAKTQRACRNGPLVLAFEKRMSPRTDRTRFEIVDTVRVTTAVPARELAITFCSTATGKPRQYFVLYKWVPAANKRHLPHPRRAWEVNAQGRLVEVPVKTLRCLNNDYGAN